MSDTGSVDIRISLMRRFRICSSKYYEGLSVRIRQGRSGDKVAESYLVTTG